MTLITTQEELQALQLECLQSTSVSVDTETNITDLYKDRYCLGISVATDRGGYYVPVGHKSGWLDSSPNNVEVSDWFLKDLSCPIVFHNAKFDLQVLSRMGLKIPLDRIYDTMMMAHFIDENVKGEGLGHSLDAVSRRYLPGGAKKDVKLAKAMTDVWEETPPYIMAKYAVDDAIATRDLLPALTKLMKPEWLEQWESYDRDFMLLLTEMETLGVPIDREMCERLEIQCEVRMREIVLELGFDPAKPSQLHPRLFGDPPEGLGLIPSEKTPGGKPKVSADWLLSVGHPVTALVYEYRRLSKQKSSYFGAYLGLTTRDYARLHPNFKQHGTVNGRLSCAEPNLEQIPREEYGNASVKKVFLPEEGKQLWEIDYRTLEYRLSAVYAQEPTLLRIFRDEGDFHQQVADDIGVSRQTAKTVNYLMSFGGGVGVLQAQLGVSYGRAKAIHSAYKAKYPTIFEKAADAADAAESSMEISMWNGRTRHFRFPGECRKAFNSVVQGGSFEIVKRSMLNLRKAGVPMSNQVHDSVWVNCDNENEVKEIQPLMEDWTTETFGLTFRTDRKRLK